MTSKDYELIARTILNQQQHPGIDANLTLFCFTAALCAELSRENSQFDEKKFMDACGFLGDLVEKV